MKLVVTPLEALSAVGYYTTSRITLIPGLWTFISSISEGTILADTLELDFYNSRNHTTTNISILHKFKNNNNEMVLVCTSALEVGIDIGSINSVIYIPPILSFIGFIQASSRIRGTGIVYLIANRNRGPRENPLNLENTIKILR